MKKTALTLFAAAAISTAATAQTITQWNFNSGNDANTATGTNVPSTGNGSLSLVGGTTSTYSAGSPGDTSTSTDNSGLNTTTYPAQGTGSGTAGVQFNVPTTGFSDQIQLSLDFRQSGTASRYFQLLVSTDGTNFSAPSGGTTSIGTIGSGNSITSFSTSGLYTNNSGGGSQTFVQNITYNLPTGSGYQNDPNFAFKWVAVFDPTGANGANYISSNAGTTAAYTSAGTARFDMVTVSVIPEPSTWAMLISGGALLLGAQRLRRRRA